MVHTVKHKQVQNEDGFTDVLVSGGDLYVYSRGNTSEFHVRRYSDANYEEKVKTEHPYFHFAISPAGKTFAILTTPSKMNDQYKQVFMSIYDSTKWTVLRKFENQMNYMIVNLQDSSIYISEDGPEMISPTMFQINFWNTKTGKERIALKSGYQGNQYKQARAAAGHRLVVTSLDYNVHAFHVYDMRRLEYLDQSDKGLSDIDKARAYVGKGEREMTMHPKDPRLAFSIPPVDPIVSIWNVTTGQRVRKLQFENMFPMAMLPVDEKHILVFEYNQKKIFFIDYTTGLMLQAISVDDLEAPNPYANTWEVINGHNLLTVASNKADLNVWSLKSGRVLRTIKTGHKKMATFIVSRDKSTLFSCEKSDDYSKPIPVHVTDIKKGKRISIIKGDGMHFDLRPEVVSVSDDGKLFSFVKQDMGTVALVDTQTGNIRHNLTYSGPDKEHVIYSSVLASMMALNGGYVAAVATCQVQKGDSYEMQYRLVAWSISTGRHLAWHPGGHFLKMTATEDGNRLLTVSTASVANTRKAVELWDMTAIQSGHIQMLARFLPETDIRFCHLSLQGTTVCVGMTGKSEIVFFVPCGMRLKQEENDKKECPITNVVYHHKPKK